MYDSISNARKGASRYNNPLLIIAIGKVVESSMEKDEVKRILQKDMITTNSFRMYLSVKTHNIETCIKKAKREGDRQNVEDLIFIKNWFLANKNAIEKTAKSLKKTDWAKNGQYFETVKVDTDKLTIEVV